MTAEQIEPGDHDVIHHAGQPVAVVVPLAEFRVLSALRKTASAEALAYAQEVARQQELDALEESGVTGDMSEEEVRQLFGIAERSPNDRYVSVDEVRQRLGLLR